MSGVGNLNTVGYTTTKNVVGHVKLWHLDLLQYSIKFRTAISTDLNVSGVSELTGFSTVNENQMSTFEVVGVSTRC